MQLHTLYPSFVLERQVTGLSPNENKELARLAWVLHKKNVVADGLYSKGDETHFKVKPACLFETNSKNEVVMKLAKLSDEFARAYLKTIYHYDCQDPINMLAEAFCQNYSTGTAGLTVHSHRAPIVIIYYPSVHIKKIEPNQFSHISTSGELDFYNPAGHPRKLWPDNNPAHHSGTMFRLHVREGLMLAFEGYLPHASMAFAGIERVCIAISCSPEMPHKNAGKTLQELYHVG